MEHEDGRTFVWFVSQHDELITAEPEFAGAAAGATLKRLDGDEGSGDGGALRTVELPPFGVVVMGMTL